jgi:hypothetical protein
MEGSKSDFQFFVVMFIVLLFSSATRCLSEMCSSTQLNQCITYIVYEELLLVCE